MVCKHEGKDCSGDPIQVPKGKDYYEVCEFHYRTVVQAPKPTAQKRGAAKSSKNAPKDEPAKP